MSRVTTRSSSSRKQPPSLTFCGDDDDREDDEEALEEEVSHSGLDHHHHHLSGRLGNSIGLEAIDGDDDDDTANAVSPLRSMQNLEDVTLTELPMATNDDVTKAKKKKKQKTKKTPTNASLGKKKKTDDDDDDDDVVVFPKLCFFRPTIADESVWTRDARTGEIHVQVVKCKKAEPWVGAFVCDSEATASMKGISDEERKRMMRARFQRDHPGFDFSEAEFEDGKEIPDASEWNVK